MRRPGKNARARCHRVDYDICPSPRVDVSRCARSGDGTDFPDDDRAFPRTVGIFWAPLLPNVDELALFIIGIALSWR